MAAREFELEIAALSGTLGSIEKVIDLPKLRIEAKELEEAAGIPNLWDDPEAAQKVTSKLSRVQSEINRVSSLRQRLDDLPVLLELARGEEDQSALEDAGKELDSVAKAISELEAFNGKGTAFASMAKGCLGDAYMETNNTKKAIDCYMDASANKADEVITPMYLLRAAMANEMAKNNEEAKRLYIEIRDQYATSPQARDVEKNLARLGELGN